MDVQAELDGRDYAVELRANIASEPPEITLQWPGDQYARGYVIKRKLRDEKAWREIGAAEGPSTGFVDRDVQSGRSYEYQVIKDSSFDITAYGYIYAGMNLPLVEDRGTLILLTASNLAAPLAPELLRLEYDLIGDGWHVERATVAPTNSPAEVKAVIQSIYAKAPDRTRALFLFGNIPVPYSGNIMPDGHENHQGAWPADVYYADLDGVWTDETVNSTVAEVPRNWNVPGDGKFDQDEPPTALELQVGRVDLSRMTCFENKTPSRSELDLARQYLDKDHRFRAGEFPVQQRAIIFDRIESKTAEPVAAMAWRNFAPFVGSEVSRIADFEYFPKVSTGTYLWSSVCAGGGPVGSDHVGTSDYFALYDANVVFTTFLGSYYGDWDVESAFLRAPLGAKGTLLTTAYSGQPQWMFHHMALGETIGFSARITQENNTNGVYMPHNSGAGQVHISLLGDPSLRAHPIPAVRNLRAQRDASGLTVGWQVPVIDGLAGFLVYKAEQPGGPYVRVTPEPVPQAFARVPDWKEGETIMVKAVALTRTPSGSYYNGSVGVFYPDRVSGAFSRPPDAPVNLSVAKASPASITLTWVGAPANTTGYRIERAVLGGDNFREIASISGDATTFEDKAFSGSGKYVYRMRAFNAFGISGYSNEAIASTLSGACEFVTRDDLNQGNWMGVYGRQGYVLPGLADHLPDYLSLVTSNTPLYKTSMKDDVRCPQVAEEELRSANCWVSGTPMGFQLNFADDEVHQVAFYLQSWSRRNPYAEVEAFDAVSGASLDKRTFYNFDEGSYFIYNMKRQVYLEIRAPNIFTNAEVYAVFVDPVSVLPVHVTPASGEFSGRTEVTLATPTPNAEIFYTLDGSEPTRQSARYASPLTLRADAQLRTRAFREGFDPSPIAEADYRNVLKNVAGFLSSDGDTHGNWPGKYGGEGVWLPLGDAAFPAFAEASIAGGNAWTWSDDTPEERALLARSDAELRQARTWFADDAMTLTVSIYDAKMHAVSLYFLDWDQSSRAEILELLGAQGEVLSSYPVDGFGGGRYVTVAVQGTATLRIRKLHGPNAVLSGIFIDAAPSVSAFARPAPLTGLTLNAGRLSFSMEAFPGLRVCVDRSSDLVHWECTSTNELAGSTATFTVPVDEFEKGHFFRTHFVP